jgi:hypothetical protein
VAAATATRTKRHLPPEMKTVLRNLLAPMLVDDYLSDQK